MESYDIEIAKLFKERENLEIQGAIIGRVVNISPLKLSVYEGQVTLDKNQLYICDSCLQKDFKIGISTNDVAGEVLLKSDGQTYDYEIMNLSTSIENTSVVLKFEMKLSDELLLIPTADGQKFFIVDKVRKLV